MNLRGAELTNRGRPLTLIVMRRTMALLILVTLVVACFPEAPPPRTAKPPAEPATELVLAVTEWPPFTDEKGKPQVATDVVRATLDATGTDVRIAVVPITTWLEDIKAGKYSGSAALWKSPDREEVLLFSRPYLENRLVLIARTGEDVTATALGQLTGKRVAIVAGYAYGDAVANAKGPELVKGTSTPENIRKLVEGAVDYVLADALLAHHVIESHPQKEQLQIGEPSLVSRTLHLGLRRDVPGAAEIIKRFNAQLDKMIANGTYNRILGVEWIRADVDGDGEVDMIHSGKEAGTAPPEQSYEVVRPRQQETGPRTRFRGAYFIDGQRYEDWENVPDTFKIAPTRPGMGVKLLEW